MSETPPRIIPIRHDDRTLALPVRSSSLLPSASTGPIRDRLDRPLQDLRISVTDRCNFRCSYCMPREVFDKHRFLPHSALLHFEEITRAARAMAGLGVRKLRLTGGEPLLRRDLDQLVAQLAALTTPEGKRLDLTLTTNGSLLARHARKLRDAGLNRVTVSLDAIDDAVFRRMNDVDFPVADVLAGIDAAIEAGLAPVKINMVVKRGTNDAEIVPMVHTLRDRYGAAVRLRFIEYMDVGSSNGWRMDEVLPSAEVLRRIGEHVPLVPLPAETAGETASRWAFADGRGEIGLISSVSQPFCHDCNRLRLSTDGRLYTCLFATQGWDLRALLRDGQLDDETLRDRVAALWQQRGDRYSELRSAGRPTGQEEAGRRIEMSFIGG